MEKIFFCGPPLICPVRVLSSVGAGNYNTIHCGKLPVFNRNYRRARTTDWSSAFPTFLCPSVSTSNEFDQYWICASDFSRKVDILKGLLVIMVLLLPLIFSTISNKSAEGRLTRDNNTLLLNLQIRRRREIIL